MAETKKPTVKASTASLAEALVTFQADLPKVHTDKVNPHFKSKFASLANIVEVVTPKLNAVGLSYSGKSRVTEDFKMVFIAKLTHAPSGEYEEAEYPIHATDPQKIGSAESYFRRYGFAKLTGIVVDEDDDGNAASAPEPKAIQNVRKAAAPAGKAAGTSDLQGKIRAWIGSDDARRTQVNDGVSKAKASGLSGEDAFKAVIAELGIE